MTWWEERRIHDKKIMPGSSFDWHHRAVPSRLSVTRGESEKKEAKPALFWLFLFSPLFLILVCCEKEPQVPSLVFSWKGAFETWGFMETRCLVQNTETKKKKKNLRWIQFFKKYTGSQQPSIVSSEASTPEVVRTHPHSWVVDSNR